jgi:DNA primase
MSVRTIDELKADISIEAVLEYCGARVEGGGWGGQNIPVFCPFHLNEATPAGSMNVMKGVYYCFACGASGSVIDLAMLHLNTKSIPEAMDWLERTFL